MAADDHADSYNGEHSSQGAQQSIARPLPLWRVLLHNDDVNAFHQVITTVVSLTHLNAIEAKDRVVEAHEHGVSLLLVTHQERAELYQQQFGGRNLTITIEPAQVEA